MRGMKHIKIAESPEKILSAKGLFVRAIVLFCAFLVSHLAGFRRFTGFLCGTLETGAAARGLFALFGVLYVILFMLFTIVVPVLIIGAILVYTYTKCSNNMTGQ